MAGKGERGRAELIDRFKEMLGYGERIDKKRRGRERGGKRRGRREAELMSGSVGKQLKV